MQTRYVVDNDLIDKDTYTVTVNPTNLEVTNINCEEIIKSSDEAFAKKEIDTIEDTMTCLRIKLTGTSNRDKFWRLLVLTGLGIIEEQKKVEKEHFVNFLKQVDISQIVSCL